MKKRILTVLLAVCLVFALGTVSALAADSSDDCAGGDSCNHEAAIGATHYDTLGEAITAANQSNDANVVVTLLRDVELNLQNGNTTGAYTITKNGVTINGSSSNYEIKATGTGTNCQHVFLVQANNVTISNLEIDGGRVARSGIQAWGNVQNLNLTNVTSNNNYGYGVLVNNGASVTANNLVAHNNGWGGVNVDAQNEKSSFTMVGGDLTNNGAENVISIVLDSDVSGENTVSLTGGKYDTVMTNTPDTDNNNAERSQGKNNVTINGATVGTISLNGTGTDKVDIINNATVNEIVSGRTDSAKPAITVTGSTVEKIDTSKFELKANDSEINGSDQTDSVAKVGDQYFDTLQAAIDAAQNGTTKTVTLLKNFEVDITNTTDSLYRINGSITIDGDNRTITIKDIDAERDVKIFNVTSGTVTFEDLTIDGNDVAKHGIQAFGTGTNVTLNNVTSNENTGYGVLANGGAKVSATKLYTDDNGWGGVNVDKGAKFTMNSGTLGEEFSVVVESQDNSVTSDTVANLINGTYNKIQIKTNKSDVNISGGSYTDIVGYSDSKGSYTPNSGDASVTGGTFRNNVNEFATVNYVVSGSRGYTYFNDFDKAMAYAGVGDDIDFIGSSTTRTHTVRFYYENNVYDVYEVVHDDEVELPTGQYDGKRIDGWKRDDGKVFKPGDDVTITRNTDFTVILRNGQYNIVIDDDIKHGDVSTDVSSADKGATVYIYVDPDIGYVLDDLNVYYGANNRYSVTVSYVRAGVYKFTMPNASVYITATFKYAALPFTDVNRSQWFYDEVYYVYTNGMMEGDSATTFNPDGRMTRAMFWAVLGRIDGATITGNDWAEEARAWAMREGVSDGTNPNDYVTREQMVTMLWRYAGEKNGSASLIRYTDADKISSYAVEAMRWAIGNGIIEGMTSTTLEPQGTATRAQCAAIFMRFDQM